MVPAGRSRCGRASVGCRRVRRVREAGFVEGQGCGGYDGGEVVGVCVVLTGVGLDLGRLEGRTVGGAAGDVVGLGDVRDHFADVEGSVDDAAAAGCAEDADLGTRFRRVWRRFPDSGSPAVLAREPPPRRACAAAGDS